MNTVFREFNGIIYDFVFIKTSGLKVFVNNIRNTE